MLFTGRVRLIGKQAKVAEDSFPVGEEARAFLSEEEQRALHCMWRGDCVVGEEVRMYRDARVCGGAEG